MAVAVDKLPHPVPYNLYDPWGVMADKTEEQKAKGRLVELNNGRAAMVRARPRVPFWARPRVPFWVIFCRGRGGGMGWGVDVRVASGWMCESRHGGGDAADGAEEVQRSVCGCSRACGAREWMGEGGEGREGDSGERVTVRP